LKFSKYVNCFDFLIDIWIFYRNVKINFKINVSLKIIVWLSSSTHERCAPANDICLIRPQCSRMYFNTGCVCRWTRLTCGVRTRNTWVAKDWWWPRWDWSLKRGCSTSDPRRLATSSGTGTTGTWNLSAWPRWARCTGNPRSKVR
jgi:hypothetical protein